ncbi:MAG: hypothetical protein M3024_14655 [Candidatus Dormibacteraeota bacterium]|nr:hypothetical protein [Candidatus Dormibacteraeota bacterium]
MNDIAADLIVIFAAGVSNGIGTQSLVLLLNSDSRRRFGLNLVLAGVAQSTFWLLWGTSIWALSRLLLGAHQPFAEVVGLARVAAVPYLLGFS